MDEIPATITDTSRRHEFVLMFDVTNGNPNGDPDAANLPRMDPESGHGLVTDVAIKRKVRNYLALAHNLPIFIQSESALNTLKSGAADRVDPPLTPAERSSGRPIPRLQSRLCSEFYDIRMFGAVLATGEAGDRLNAGQVRGPLQVTFARSIDRIAPMDATITRQARTTEERMETGTTEMGRKSFVPYGLYRAHGYFNPFLAERTGVSTDDLQAFWQALTNLFEFDRSASRGDMAVCGLYVFTHENKLGNASARSLFNLITVDPVQQTETARPPRQFSDYAVRVDRENLPPGVTLTALVG